jgi:hypothetical protein
VSSDQVLDKEAIRELKARYFRLMDTKDWSGWKALFTPDLVAKTDMAKRSTPLVLCIMVTCPRSS